MCDALSANREDLADIFHISFFITKSRDTEIQRNTELVGSWESLVVMGEE